MSQPSTQIPLEIIQRSGGDWGGYGELSWQQLMELGQQGRIRLLFAGDSILVWVLRQDGLSGVYKLLHTQDQPPQPQLPFSNETVAIAANSPLKNVQVSWPLVYKTMVQYGIQSPLNCAGVIGTIAKETGNFLPVREAFYLYDLDPVVAEQLFKLNPAPAYRWYRDTTAHAEYEGGPDYHGRGFIQTTHKGNYQKVKDRSGLDVVTTPDLLLQPEPAAHALCIYWQDRAISPMCERRDWPAVRAAVYGQEEPDGIAKLQRAAQVLGV